MIDVLAVDRWSGRTHGWLHRASAPAKIVAAGACISVLITSRDVATLALVYAGLLAALVTSGLPVRPLLAAAEEVICAPLQSAYACVQECCVAAEQSGEGR